jgi:hypothetical protein
MDLFGRRVVINSSGDVGILAVGSHSECPVSDGLVGVDKGDEQIEPLIVSVNDSDYAHVPGPKPVHGNLSAAVEPDAVRSAVPSGHDQRDPTDRGSLGFECVGQCGELDGWICRTWPPRAVESTCWEAVGLQAEPRAGG